ncbi:Transcription factor prr1 [Neolecta irregularis DAH-3]|uniref:Transcription factor n=1 Tax=Neolecta irregularis (strain DAH-3) TaxID=1198029 RepID=A0A1U7LIP5_NEOID|nr:Transcription factor prr1 [Neolecta irregularis DAH-3]|eukprot:OLL22498.1 Transcription factor prr1 [Neolecta irregularis DAH-3]
MLEESEYAHIVRWSDGGDSFIVLDTNEFTKAILPRHFKHSNFASFVRQLNKYDFHKVRNNEEGGINPYGEGAWEFRHPDFQVHNKDLLDNIKASPRRHSTLTFPQRKAPAQRKIQMDEPATHQINILQQQVDTLTKLQSHMNAHLQGLSKNYQSVISEMLTFQRNMVAQDQVMQNLIQYLVNLEGDQQKTVGGARGESSSPTGPFIPSEQARKLISSYTEVTKASFEQMNELSRRAQSIGPPSGVSSPESRRQSDYLGENDFRVLSSSRTKSRQQCVPVSQSDNRTQNLDGGLRVFTVGHLAPRRHEDVSTSLEHSNSASMPMSHFTDGESRNCNSLRVTRSTFIPGWAVPPRVLLVEDDAVCRRLSSKFLQVFGCEIDLAVGFLTYLFILTTKVDGVSAVNKMNFAKYDLVLMDIVMPNLDGVSATSLIRQFDPLTPIISMTSNVQSGDVMTYFSHGMNDILPKPFTKDGLLGMLEKHLIHLKTIKDMQNVPRNPSTIDNNPRITETEDEISSPSNHSPKKSQEKPSRHDQSHMDNASIPSPYNENHFGHSDSHSNASHLNSPFSFTDSDYLHMLSGMMGPAINPPTPLAGLRRSASQMEDLALPFSANTMDKKPRLDQPMV